MKELIMKVAIIGTGHVGATLAFCLANNKKIDRLFLINRTKDTAEGLKYDLMGCFPERGDNIIIGNYKDANNANIIVITCGISGAPSGTDLFSANKQIVKNIMEQIKPRKDAKIIVIATPVDEISKVVYELSGLDKTKVIGFGGQLDVKRLGYLIRKDNNDFSKKLKVSFVGLHGAQGIPIFDEKVSDKEKLKEESKNYYKTYLAGRKFSTYAVASEIARLVNVLMNEKPEILNVSYFNETHDIFITWPCKVNKSGIKAPVDLNLPEDCEKELEELIEKRKTFKR